MSLKRLPILFLLLLVAGVGIVAASTIDLTGSDSAPTEVRVSASCLTNEEYIPTIVDAGNGGGNDNPNGGGNGNGAGNGGGNQKLTAIEVRGTYQNCSGSQIQVIVALTDGSIFYAVRAITDNSQSFTFRFDVHTGDFTDTAPQVINGVLTSQGGRVPPPPNKLLSDIQALVSNDWH